MTGRIRNFNQPNTEPRVKIVGATEITGQEPKRLDHNTKQEHPAPEIVVHEETLTEKDKIRGKKPSPGDPEVRVRAHSREWPKIKSDDQ